jgi:hypothetical protein
VWTERQDLEPRLGPFDPNAVLDEIRSLVPAYRSRHVDLSGLNRLVLNRTVGRISGCEHGRIADSGRNHHPDRPGVPPLKM